MFIYIGRYTVLMEKIPCEFIVWNILPSIRKELAKSLMRNYDLNQKQVAELINLSSAAVSQYLSNKRGGIMIINKDILREIDKSARIIYENGTAQLTSQTCRICNLLKFTEPSSLDIGFCKNNEISCETAVWNILPVIRKEFAKNLIEIHGFNQRKVANVLGITEAAVSRYVSGKRGYLEITDNTILEEIQKSTNRIIKGKDKTVWVEICRICNLLKSSELAKGKNKCV
jgi:predicted transcriptional regulator